MTAHPPRNYTKLVAATLIAAVAIAAGVFASSHLGTTTTVTRTLTTTNLVASPTIQTSTVTNVVTQASTVTSLATSTVVQSSTTTNSVTAISTTISTVTSIITYLPLQLQLKLNATTIPFGGSILAQISLFNPLSENFSIASSTTTNSTIISWNGYDFICDTSPMSPLAGYALFDGFYTSANISSAGDPLTLAPPIEPPCALLRTPDSYVFLPNSSSALAYYSGSYESPTRISMAMNATTESCWSLPTGAQECGVGTALFGYWNATGLHGALSAQNATTSSQYFRYFSPGEYTLAVEDAWGQTVYAYFRVASPSPIEVVSVTGPIPPYNPGGPVVSVVLANAGDAPITALNATILFNSSASSAKGQPTSYTFAFGVSSSNPLPPGQSIQDKHTLIGAGFETGSSYPLTIDGTLESGRAFSYTLLIRVSSPD